MTSKIKVDNINKVSDDSNIIKKCGTTTTIGSGASNPIVVDGSAVTLGRCGGTVALASGATQTGFGRTGTVDWQTTPKTATFTAVSGEGYFCNTTGSAFTVNLPAGSAGAIVSVADYAGTWQTNALTVSANGSEKIGGVASSPVSLSTEGQSVTLVYVDGTQGWINTMDSTSNVRGSTTLVASVTGACNTLVTAPCCANVKIATFTGPGSFIVSGTSLVAAENTVGYMVVAGGGGNGNDSPPGAYSGGGGAGGYREGRNVPIDNFTASPLVANAPTNAVTVTAQSYPITVGAGGAGRVQGSNSIFDSIISAGGGFGAMDGGAASPASAGTGGSGGGGNFANTGGGSGNTPPTSPSQGNNGGTGINTPPAYGSGGGGGAGAVGQNGSTSKGGNGGAGVSSSITGASVARAGGGGGFAVNSGIQGGTGGTGGGGPGYGPAGPTGTPGTVNTGGGSGGSNPGAKTNGGSGIVVIRYKFQ